MRIVSIDSSLGSRLLVCEATGPTAHAPVRLEVLTDAEQADSRRHAESLGPMLAGALADPAVAARPLDAVVVATGPAPFTGLRAGLVTARVIGRVRAVPVHGVPSPDALARAALDELAAEGAGADAVVLVATDARRKEVYAARYRARGADDVERLDDLVVGPPERAADLGGADAVAGSGAVLHPRIAGGRPVLAAGSGDARAQVRIALARLAAGEALGTEPLYLRHADVQMPAGGRR